MSPEDAAFLETAREAARLAGEVLSREFGRLRMSQIGIKGRGDYVTELDCRSEEIIIEHIKKSFPGHIIHAEESGEEHRDSAYRWLVDPLDGTANYVQGIPMYGVSIAVLSGVEIRVGVVYDPERDEMFWAVSGEGAFLNGDRIQVSEKNEMAYSMLASGFPWRSKNHIDPYVDCFKHLFIQAAGIRRMGAAAVDLAYTACGRFDGFWEMKLGPWDIAAGVLLVEEAGGAVTDFQGTNQYMKTGNVVAGNPVIHRMILNETQEHLSRIH